MERQAEKAKTYLKKREELKAYDVNMFLMEMERMEKQSKDLQEKIVIVDHDLKESNRSYDSIKAEYEQMEQDMQKADERLQTFQKELNDTTVLKENKFMLPNRARNIFRYVRRRSAKNRRSA